MSDYNYSQIPGQIWYMDIHVPLRMNHYLFGDTLTFHPECHHQV